MVWYGRGGRLVRVSAKTTIPYHTIPGESGQENLIHCDQVPLIHTQHPCYCFCNLVLTTLHTTRSKEGDRRGGGWSWTGQWVLQRYSHRSCRLCSCSLSACFRPWGFRVRARLSAGVFVSNLVVFDLVPFVLSHFFITDQFNVEFHIGARCPIEDPYFNILRSWLQNLPLRSNLDEEVFFGGFSLVLR